VFSVAHAGSAFDATGIKEKSTMVCEKYFLGIICLVKPSSNLDSSIFGFAEFLVALALLVIVYTISDVRYRFRVAIAPTPLYNRTFYLIGIIGFGTLLTDIWIAEGWLVPESYITLPVWQGIFAVLFLTLVMTWMYYAFINPPIYSVKNFRNFAQKLYRIILKGADNDLSIIASELQRSAKSLVELAQTPPEFPKKDNERIPNVGDYARDIMLLIGNRKLCRHIIASSPITAMEFFDEMAKYEKYPFPMGQFARNISAEAIINKDSILYHEDEGYDSGLIGYIKPFSQSIYGNYRLVEGLGSRFASPFHIDYEIVTSWDASQVKAYSRAVLVTFTSYLEDGDFRHSYALYTALKNMETACYDVYKLNDIQSDNYSIDVLNRLRAVVSFVNNAINLMNERENVPPSILRVRDRRQWNYYDHIANLMFKIIHHASSVTSPPDKCWLIHYNIVWSEFFSLNSGEAWDIIHFKLRRLLYDEILQLKKYPNYKSSGILGICLNVMGLGLGNKEGFMKAIYPLHKAVLSWTKKNYLRLRSIHPEVADACLIGSISFDEENARLVKTYIKGLSLEAPKEYLELIPGK
jgi:hypothetical protein